MLTQDLSVVKVRDVLLVTMPGDPDDKTISQLQDKILYTVEIYEPKGVILDVSAVEAMDSFFARTLVEISQMVKLMGGHTAIAGMRPNVAITVTQLGLSFGKILTALDVERAIDILEDRNMGGE